ncbi:MAG: GNAT family N-acetyltransferase [Oscillospiraceae bacterium]|nr:GNAT family N-acetyltransferase [Oscillospiraceae bacterium]
MELKRIHLQDPDCDLARALNREAFPENERIELDDLLADGQDDTELLGIYTDSRFAGFLFLRTGPGIVYLAYFAVCPELRNQGIGGRALQMLREFYTDAQIVVEFEASDDRKEDQAMRLRRKAFYLRSGFYETGWFQYYMEDEFEIACTSKEFDRARFDALIAAIHEKVPSFDPVPYRKDTPMHPEPIGDSVIVFTSEEHRFGTDAFLLTAFSHYKAKDTAVEFGTGCGIIPLLMQKKRPPKCIYALDVQENAVAQLHAGIVSTRIGGEMPAGIHPVCADLRELWENAPLGMVDLVLCNPPYQPPGSGFEAANASQRIARHGVLCTPEDVCNAAAKLLKTGGRLCVCGRPERLPDYICAMRQAGTEPKRLQLVHKNTQSEPWLFLLEGKRGAAPFLRIDPPFIMYENGELTPEAAALYTGGSAP